MFANPKTTFTGIGLWVLAIGYCAYQAWHGQLTFNDVVMAAGLAGAGSAAIAAKDGGR